MGAGLQAGSIYAKSAPAVAAGETLTAQNVGQQAAAQEIQSGNEIALGNYNASLAALKGNLAREGEAEQYNGAGVLLEGSPLAQLEQTRRLAVNEVNNITSQALLGGNLINTESNQTINAGRAQLLGTQSAFNVGQANADIQSENVLDQDLGTAVGLGSQAVGTATKIAQAFA